MTNNAIGMFPKAGHVNADYNKGASRAPGENIIQGAEQNAGSGGLAELVAMAVVFGGIGLTVLTVGVWEYIEGRLEKNE